MFAKINGTQTWDGGGQNKTTKLGIQNPTEEAAATSSILLSGCTFTLLFLFDSCQRNRGKKNIINKHYNDPAGYRFLWPFLKPGRVSPHLLSLATLKMPTRSQVCIAGREQIMMCISPLVFTALALVGIIKQGKKQATYVEGQHVSTATSTDTSKVVSKTLLKETTHNVWSKCREMPFWHPNLDVNRNPHMAACAQRVYGRWPCTRKVQGRFAKEDCLLGEDDDGFLLQPYSQRRCLELSWPGLTAGTRGGQQLIFLITRCIPSPGTFWGCCQGCARVPCASVPPKRPVTW